MHYNDSTIDNLLEREITLKYNAILNNFMIKKYKFFNLFKVLSRQIFT